MKVSELREALRNGETKFAFIKKSGEVRVALGTTNLDFIPSENHPKGDKAPNDKVVTFFDLEKQAWRCLSASTEFITE